MNTLKRLCKASDKQIVRVWDSYLCNYVQRNFGLVSALQKKNEHEVLYTMKKHQYFKYSAIGKHVMTIKTSDLYLW